MTRAEFKSASVLCKFCDRSELEVRDSKQHPGGGVWCRSCQRHQLWLSLDRAEYHRPALKRGTTDQVWNAWGIIARICGLSESQLETLGIGKTTQHCQPFRESGHEDAFFIPLCTWCQQHSATTMKQLGSLVSRLREQR